MDEMLLTFEDKMEKTMENLGSEFAAIRAGRANPALLNKIMVDYYGTPTPIQQVANISVPEARMMQIRALGQEPDQGDREGDQYFRSWYQSRQRWHCDPPGIPGTHR